MACISPRTENPNDPCEVTVDVSIGTGLRQGIIRREGGKPGDCQGIPPCSHPVAKHLITGLQLGIGISKIRSRIEATLIVAIVVQHAKGVSRVDWQTLTTLTAEVPVTPWWAQRSLPTTNSVRKGAKEECDLRRNLDPRKRYSDGSGAERAWSWPAG